MWGYGRADDTGLTLYKTEREHFDLFCMVMERGFALHTGRSNRLVLEYQLTDTGSDRYLPKVRAKSGVSFLIPDNWLKPSNLYLYYDPANAEDVPRLAEFNPATNQFIPYTFDHSDELSRVHSPLQLPIVKLSTLKGLHYIKDIACLPLFEADFDQLFQQDPALAEQVRISLTHKLKNYMSFAQPWLKADKAQRIAQEYLERHGTPSSSSPRTAASGKDDDADFLNWD